MVCFLKYSLLTIKGEFLFTQICKVKDSIELITTQKLQSKSKFSISILLTQNDIDQIFKISDISLKFFFPKSLPEYSGIKVY